MPTSALDVGDPQPVRAIGDELALHMIRPGRLRALVVTPPPPVDPGQAVTGHQTSDPASPDLVRAAHHQLGMNPAHTVGRPRSRVDLDDRVQQVRVLDIARRRRTFEPLVVSRRRHAQDPARHRDGEPVSSKLTNEPEPYFGSTFSRAK